MKFNEEDKIITAEEARERSDKGVEDSVIRESIREVMAEIKHMSTYGFGTTGAFIRIKTQEEFDLIKLELEKLGYKIDLIGTEESHARDRSNYNIKIAW